MPLPAGMPGWALEHLADIARLEAPVSVATTDAQGIMHFDLRPDNVIMVGGQAVILDWNWARPGPAAADTVMLLLPAFGQFDVDTLVAAHPTMCGLGKDVIDGILAALGGFMIVAAAGAGRYFAVVCVPPGTGRAYGRWLGLPNAGPGSAVKTQSSEAKNRTPVVGGSDYFRLRRHRLLVTLHTCSFALPHRPTWTL